jgi:hypothetical protein
MSSPPPPPPADRQPFSAPTQAQYGEPPPGYAPYGASVVQPGLSGMAIAGFVLSLVGLFPGFWFWWLQVPAYLGTIFSVVGLKATKASGKRGRGLAIAGFVIGLVGILAAALFTLYVYTSDSCDVESPFKFTCSID